ncbi:methyl-accepting chemotaxis protein [Paenibacillus sp. 22594]|uniref:methyl-accepting chemotaxis protein n=1 Tax=Paenibacillus sp. 22594 TaxID=3453947 RepID=UPI003F8789FB
MKHLKVRHKMLLLVTIFAILLFGIGAIGMITTNRMADRSKEAYNQNLQPIYLITEIRGNNRAIESFLLESLITKDDAKNQVLNAAIEENINTNNKLISQLKGISLANKEISNKIFQYLSLLPDYRAQRDNIIKLAGKHLSSDGYQIYSDTSFKELRKTMVGLLDDASVLLVQDAENHNVKTLKNAKNSMTASISLIVTALLLCAGIGFMISRMITKPLRELQMLMKRAETGDLTAAASYDSRDEIGQINGSFNTMLDSLKLMMQGVSESAEMLSASSQQMSASAEQTASASRLIAETSSEIATGFDAQAETIDRTAQSVQTIVKDIAAVERGSNEMSVLMAEATAFTARGADAVEVILGQMKQMDSSFSTSREMVSNLGRLTAEINSIQEFIRNAARQTEEICKATLHVSLEAQSVSKAMEQVSEVSRKGAGEVQDTSAASEEQLTAMGEMSMSAQYLATLAENLQMDLARFKL